MEATKKSTHCLKIILFGILIFFTYSNSFHVPWQLDDKPNILKNTRLQIQDISIHALLKAASARPGSSDLYRPVACISLGLNWFFGQDHVFGYHLVNLVIHISTAWILFLVVKLIFATPRLKGRLGPVEIETVSVLTALFWALHPIQVQAVTYIVQRMASMAGMFSILAIYFYFKARLTKGEKRHRLNFFLLAGLSYVLALMSKENTVTLILCLPIFELLFFEHTLSRDFVKKIIGGLSFGCIFSLLAAMILRPEAYDFILNYYVNRPFTLSERVLTEQRILIIYLSQIFFPVPWRFSIEHDISLSTSLFSPWTTWAAILLNLLLIFSAVRMGKKHPFYSLAILFYYCNHLVESTVLPLELVFEHRNYLPSFFLFLPVADGLNWILTQIKNRKIMVAILTGFISFLLAAEGYATFERNKVWQTEESLWLDALAKAPNSARPLATLAIKLAWGPNPSDAKYRKALALTEKTLSMRMARSLLDAAQLGNMASIHNKMGNYELSNTFYKKALDLAPKNVNIRYNFSKNLAMAGSFIEAKNQLIYILENGYVHADYFHMLGFIHLWMDQPEMALPALQQALKYAPLRPDILLTLGKCLSAMGYHKKAQWYYSLTKKNGRDDLVVMLCSIENALIAQDQRRAEKSFQRGIQLFSFYSIFQFLNLEPERQYREVPIEKNMVKRYLNKKFIEYIGESTTEK